MKDIAAVKAIAFISTSERGVVICVEFNDPDCVCSYRPICTCLYVLECVCAASANVLMALRAGCSEENM